jgi:soluble lytic murein transglycosylase-like protein
MTNPVDRSWPQRIWPAVAGALLMLPMLACHAQSGPADNPGNPSNSGGSKPKIYKHLAGGIPVFSDVPPTNGAYIILNESCYACSLTSTINWHTTKLHLDEFDSEISSAAQTFRLESSLVRAVIHAESGFKPLAKSRKGAVGLMQLMPFTAREVGVVDANIPMQNIRGGVQYLAGLLMQFKGDITLATAAYNAGPGAVEKYKGIPPYAETQAYVQRVAVLHQRYKSALPR